MEKVKEFIRKYKWLAVGLGAVLVVVLYKLFFSRSSESGGVAMQALPRQDTTGGAPAGAGGGGSSGLSAITDLLRQDAAARADADKAEAEQQTSFLKGLTDAMGSFMTGVRDTLTTSSKSTADAIKAINQSNANFQQQMTDMVNKIKTSAVMPDVPKFDSFDPGEQYFQQETPHSHYTGKPVVVKDREITSDNVRKITGYFGSAGDYTPVDRVNTGGTATHGTVVEVTRNGVKGIVNNFGEFTPYS